VTDLPANSASTAPAPAVELRAARIPVIGVFAHHHWFVVERGGTRDRWEVWQTANAGGIAFGHVHRNLWLPDRGVGNGPSWVVSRWTGELAHELAARIAASPETYPWCECYRLFPGPNSNTYVQWLLGDRFRLGRRAPGRAWAWRRRNHGIPAKPRR
jgi:hypothetical protein